MFFTERKLRRRFEELQQYRYRDIVNLDYFQIEEEKQGVVNPALPTDFTDWKEMQIKDTWKGRDLYLWLHKEVIVPKEWKDKKILGIFDFGKTGDGNNSGFESMIYVNQVPYQGVDSNHQEVFFQPEVCGQKIDLTFRLWSGLEGGGVPAIQEHQIKRSDIAWLDETVDQFYYMGTMILETLDVLDDGNYIKYQLKNLLDEACHCIDWSYPGNEIFYESVYEAAQILFQELEQLDKKTNVTIGCIGHTHVDVAWLWRLKHTREKISRSFTTVLRLMEQYPEYVFLQTQPQLYEYIKEDFPDIYDKIKEKVKEGRWEAEGGMWVEADCNLTSGESLTRQILLGSKFFEEEFGVRPKYLWLPDVFGYSWALPQILKKSGIDTFMTTKISWNQYNRMPHDTFWWKGMDGSEILAHFITTIEPWHKEGSWFYTYNGRLTPKTVKGTWEAYSEKEMNHELLISYGYGDGGGGVNREMLEQRRCIDKIPGLPSLKPQRAGEYFDNLKNTVEDTKQFVHTWDGELYFEYHRGTYTSQSHNKKMNRFMELLYRRVEWMTIMHGIYQGSLSFAKQEKLTMGWKKILTNQFHDIIPGSSIHEVYQDSKEDYIKIEEIAKKVETEFFDTVIEKEDGTYTVINSLNWERSGLLLITDVQEGSYEDAQGNALATQKTKDGLLVCVSNVPPMGFKTIHMVQNKRTEEKSPFQVNDKTIETPYYIISFNQYGQITRLFDKTYTREILPKGERANVLQVFEDKPIDNDAWDLDIFYQEKMREVTELLKFQIDTSGSLCTAIHIEWNYMSSSIHQDIILYSNQRNIDFQTYVDYHEQHQLIKAAFPLDIRSNYGTFDIQYGNVRRPNHWNTSWDLARFESVAHRFVDMSDRNYGVSLLNNCKYGHDIKDNVMRISLLKAATHPDHLADQGEHRFTYSLLPHEGDFVEGKTVQEASALNEPLQCVKGKINTNYHSFLKFDNDMVELDAVKKSEDGNYIVIRFHEYAGGQQNVTMKLGFSFDSWMESDLMERPITSKNPESDISIKLNPYEIKTILVKI